MSTPISSTLPSTATTIASISNNQNIGPSRSTTVVTATKSSAAPVSSQMVLTPNASVTQTNNAVGVRSGATIQASTTNAGIFISSILS